MRTIAIMVLLCGYAHGQGYTFGDIYGMDGRRIGGYSEYRLPSHQYDRSYDIMREAQNRNAIDQMNRVWDESRQLDLELSVRRERAAMQQQMQRQATQAQMMQFGGTVPNAKGGFDSYGPGGVPLGYTVPDGSGGFLSYSPNGTLRSSTWGGNTKPTKKPKKKP